MGKIIAGAFLILLGLGFFFEQTPLRLLGLNFGTIFSLFPMLIGVLLLSRRHIFWGIFFLLWGLIGLFSGFLHVDFAALFFPLLIVALGVSILFRSPERYASFSGGKSDQNFIKESVNFGALEKSYTSQNFSGGKIETAFGGMKVDLRQVKLAKEGATLEVNAVFGGGEILVSRDMHVQASGTGVFGGWNNNFETTSKSSEPVLKITGSAVFGGVEVKN